ncbi:MAG: ATP-binding cassette, subfamily bacterial [Gemmatimonadaceae bacterium]|jgi:ATP-binding cassette subfamily B protein|nr:ATP-binding cassette, subfamily bacterial [Gemmatimonadaceae bacterium]MEA2766924.1 ATP-binding cassette, subfamily bacterial [Gemmatimonadaceae bacterium]
MMALRVVRSLVPVATFWVGKLIIDSVIAARAGNGSLTQVWRYLALELGIVLTGEILARASSLVESLLGDLFSNAMSVRLMEHAAKLDLAQFEDPEFYDHLERARRQTVGRIALLTLLLSMSQDALTLLTLAGALIAYSPWLLLLLAIAVVPSFLGETHFASLGYSLLFRWTPERRQLDYLRFVGASDKTAKEVQMFGLAPWITERYATLSQRFYEENRALSIRRGLVSALLSILGTIGYYAAYIIILLHAVRGEITIGMLTFLAASFARGRDVIQSILMSASNVYEQALYLRDLFVFLDMRPTIESPPNARLVPKKIQSGFVFEDVGFRYPGSERWAVRNVDMVLQPGERVALVGENGAGKTTITKLMARLYDPTEGRITLDGVDLKEYDLISLRHAIGVIFQDFVRYDMRFDENIGVGEIESVRADLGKGNGTPASISTAAENSLAASLLPRFEKGYQQMLGRRFDDGVDLSGGEWQKIALARAYIRDAQVLILDEPTAALDARAEYEVFLRFSELVAGRMAVLISHRFSTVRMADRIIVLRHGKVEEQGSHEELLAKHGLYEELFAMQAAGYR